MNVLNFKTRGITMDFLSNFISAYEGFIHGVAEITVSTLELIGIIIVIVGSIRALLTFGISVRKKHPTNIVIGLGRALSVALEFKMGAEIVKTVIVHDFSELAVLVTVILIRALLAFIIHWEMKTERKDEEEKKETPTE